MPLNQYTVRHQNHAGVALGEVFPESLEFAIYLSDFGYCTYNMDLSNPMAVREMTEAYVTDYILLVDGVEIQGGEHTDIQIDDVTLDQLQVSGKEWKNYINTRIWDYDPSNPGGNIYTAFQRDDFDIVRDLLTQMMLDPNSLIITYGDASMESGTLNNYQIAPQDSETLYSKINTLATQDPGFDWEITWNKILNLYSPQKGVINNNVTFELGKNLQVFGYGETGATATKLLGLGAGTSGQVATLLENVPASQKFRRRDNVIQLGSVNSQTLNDSLTAAELARESLPIPTFSATYIPEDNFDFWNEVAIGDIVQVTGQLGYDLVDQQFRLISILSQPTDEGDQQIQLTFDDSTISL